MTPVTSPAPRARLVLSIQLLAILILAAVIVPTISPGVAIRGNAVVKLLFLGRIVLLVGLATWFLSARGLGWREVGLRRPRWLRFALGIPLGIAGSVALAYCAHAVASGAGARTADYSMFAPVRGNLPLYLFVLIPVTWGTAAFGEEMIFRGFVLDALRRLIGEGRRYASYVAAVLQAIAFGLLHLYQGPAGATNAAMIGLVLGLVWLFTGRNLWAGIVIHGLFDSAAMTAIYLGVMRV